MSAGEPARFWESEDCRFCGLRINKRRASPRVSAFFCKVQCAIDFAIVTAETSDGV